MNKIIVNLIQSLLIIIKWNIKIELDRKVEEVSKSFNVNVPKC